MSLKLVNLGLPKSGTSTFARAVRNGGWSCADHKVPETTVRKTNSTVYVGELMYRGLYTLGDPAGYLKAYDAISEMSVLRTGKSLWPQMDFGIIDALRRLYPDLRVVATRRDTFEMSQSMLAWSNLGDRLEKTDIPGLPAGYGETSKARMQWIDGHYAHLQAIFAGDDRFLELDVSADDARETLSGFLGIDLPWWGRVNANPMTKAPEAT